VVGAGDKEVLHVSRKDGIAIVERRRNGKPIEGSRREHWSDWNLSNAMLEELRGGGRSLDGMPMEVLFEDSSIKDVENYLEHLVMQFNRGEFPKGAVHCSPEARQLLNEPVISASATTTSRAGAANASLLVGVTVKTQRGRIRMAVCLREVNGVTEARVQRIVGDALDAGVRLHVTHEEMPARIRESLVHDLNALDDWTGGASYIDMGDHKATRLDTLPSEFRLASAGEVGR
jgi:hypothetical protein